MAKYINAAVYFLRNVCTVALLQKKWVHKSDWTVRYYVDRQLIRTGEIGDSL